MSRARQDDGAISYDALSARLRDDKLCDEIVELRVLLAKAEAERDRLQKRLDDRIRSRPKVSRRDLDAANKRLRTERDRLHEFFEASVACEADDADDETFDRLYRARAALDKAEET